MIRILLSMIIVSTISFAQNRVEIGQRAYINLIETKLSYLARIDSGAKITSLHAINIKLKGPASLIHVDKIENRVKKRYYRIKNEDYIRNIGREISFDTINESGEEAHLKAIVFNVTKVRNAQGVEYRYVIRLGVKYGSITKFSEVNIRDRSKMTYKLLIGRNWLNNDFMIKTDMDVKRED